MNAGHERHCPLNEQAVGWALHALEPDEEMAVLLHVPGCLSCQAVARDTEEVLSHFGTSVEQVEPPRSLRSSILAAAADTPQLPIPTARRSAVEPLPVEPLPVPPPRHRAPEQVQAAPHRGSWLTRRRLVAASVALIGVMAIGGLAVRTTQLEQESQTLTARAQSIADLVGQLDRPGAKHAMLSSLQTGGTTAAVVIVDGKRQVFSVGLPTNPSDNTYVLWGLRAGAEPKALGAFDVTPGDAGVRTVVGAGAQNDGFTDYAISIEPGRTPPPKPSDVLAKGPVEA